MKNPALLEEEREGRVFMNGPFLSHSRVSRYLHCPEQYRLYYVEHMRLRIPAGNLVFGQLVHQALALLFREKEDPVKFFDEAWGALSNLRLAYGKKDSWEKLRDSGEQLLQKFLQEEFPRLRYIEAVEKPFKLDITSLEVPFVGVIDLVGSFEGKRTVVDFKTSGSSYEDHEVLMSDQLTAYQLARPEAEQAALCVLVKTKEPKIEWHVAQRTAQQLTEYLGKVRMVGQEIAVGRFFKRPGMWCSWCDFLPVCLGDRKKTEETLMKVR